MSWGHAVSRDLVHWQRAAGGDPRAGRRDGVLGQRGRRQGQHERARDAGEPADGGDLHARRKPGSQAQALAYSTDRGRTWIKRYAGNPVLDIGSGEFRDPKVFWYAPAHEWMMVVSKAVERKIAIYRSPEPQGLDAPERLRPGQRDRRRLGVPGPVPARGRRQAQEDQVGDDRQPQPRRRSPAARAAQYFVGDFDGTRFTADNAKPYTPPAGDVFADFEGADYGSWTTTGTAFGSGPAHGALPGQQTVSGFQGNGLVNSFLDFDSSQGTLTSPPFTIGRDYVNFLVGGGAHAHDPAGRRRVTAARRGARRLRGSRLRQLDADRRLRGHRRRTAAAMAAIGEQIVDTFFGNPNDGDQNTRLDRLAGVHDQPRLPRLRDRRRQPPRAGPRPDGGRTSSSTAQVVRTATGNDSGTLNWRAWDVKDLAGKRAHIEIVDRATGGWGHVLADHFVLSDIAAKIRSDETAVNLLVDGQVVRSTAGKESEALDWTSWDVSDLKGKDAQIQIVDRNSGGWGHVLADQFMFADAPAQTAEQRSSWVDYGKDFYAAVTWNDVPDGRRIAIGWMNNWNYAGAIPTDPWRSAMSVPRELALQTIDGQARLVQRPVRELRSLRGGRSFTQHHRTIPQGTTTLPVRGKALEIKADLRIGSAKQAGLKVRTGNGEETVIGYDAQTDELYVDRTRSGRVDFSRDFPGVQRAPLAARHGKVRLRILVDWSSVEVFADGGRRVITDQVFPSADSDGVELFADGGSATLDSLKVRHLRSSWATGHHNG